MRKNWTQEEDVRLRELYPSAKLSMIEKAFPGRTLSGLRQRACLLRAVRPTRLDERWSVDEIEKLRKLWPLEKQSLIEDAFPRRSWAAISARSHIFGIRRIAERNRIVNQLGECRVWTKADDAKLTAGYPKRSLRSLSRELKRSDAAINTRASRLGIRKSKETTRRNRSRSMLGKNIGRKRPDLSKRNRLNKLSGNRNPFFGKSHSRRTRAVLSKAAKMAGTFAKLAKSEDFQKKRLAALALRPNKAEMMLDALLQEEFPGAYRYTGDGKVVIDGLNPDWVSVSGKKIIELFGEAYHDPKKSFRKVELRQTEGGRRAAFENCGYAMLVIWSSWIYSWSKKRLTAKIREFHENCRH